MTVGRNRKYHPICPPEKRAEIIYVTLILMDTASTGRCLRQTKRRIFCPPAYVEVMNAASSIIRKPSFRLAPHGVHLYQLLALLKKWAQSHQYIN